LISTQNVSKWRFIGDRLSVWDNGTLSKVIEKLLKRPGVAPADSPLILAKKWLNPLLIKIPE